MFDLFLKYHIKVKSSQSVIKINKSIIIALKSLKSRFVEVFFILIKQRKEITQSIIKIIVDVRGFSSTAGK